MTAFPEHLFPPRKQVRDVYRGDVAEGRRHARKHKVAITGLARNVAATLPAVIEHVEALGELFGDYRVYVIENDSTDATPGLLRAWSRVNPRVEVSSETLGDPVNPATRDPGRAVRMANYRRKCQSLVRQRHDAEKFTRVIVADLDLPNGWSLDGVATSFCFLGYACMGSAGIIRKAPGIYPQAFRYFDCWAHRDKDHAAPHRPGGYPGKDLRWFRGDFPFEVFSCFGGLAVYNVQYYLHGGYGNGGDIEHANFHASIRANGGRIGLNPSQIVLYGAPET